jgi:Co/Zn/Cd efflux system component
MSDCCCAPQAGQRYRKVLWAALLINAAMFVVETSGSVRAGSVSLLADAIDFLGDAGNYAVSLFVLGMAAIWRSRTAYAKGLVMGAFGLLVLGRALWIGIHGQVPAPHTMGLVGMLALAANGAVALLLYAFRHGDANMRSVWLCTRNDMIGNLAVLLAAAGVFGTGAAWPDIAVACVMAALGLSAAREIVFKARMEMQA